MKERVVYLDNNATTRVSPEVVQAMEPFLGDMWGNPSSIHTFGGQVRQHLGHARERVAALIGAEPEEIIFTSCGTESNNTALKGVMLTRDPGARLITTAVEHPSVLNVCRYLGSVGFQIAELGVDGQGHLDLQQLRESIDEHTVLVSVMWANNETGVIFPIREIAEITKERGVLFHTDAVQAVGKIPVNVQEVPVDLLSLSGHKLHAPKGVGALYVRKEVKLVPLLHGGHQEGNRRGGTENVPYIVGLGRACELAQKHMEEQQARVAALRDRLERGILQSCPGAQINGDRTQRLPNTLNVSFEYVEGESILLLLDQLGICASSGSACTSGSLEPSHVIQAMGVPFTAAHGSIRFSLSRYTTDEDIDYVLQHLPGIIRRLRRLSPFVKE
ncbi:MAG TPA: cysteine desulfurase NifS [Kiritimatiellae bacterium]|nr:cysteine desulfurase NifS [Kiritimatiellia bacterium]